MSEASILWCYLKICIAQPKIMGNEWKKGRGGGCNGCFITDRRDDIAT